MEMDNAGFWMRKSTHVGRLIVQYVSWLGAAPVCWDPVQNRMVYCPTGAGGGVGNLRWKVALIPTLNLNIYFLAAFLQNLLTVGPSTEPSFAFHCGVFSFTVLSTCSHLQTVLKIEDFLCLYHRSMSYAVFFFMKYTKAKKTPPPADWIASVVMYIFYFGLLGLNLAISSAYVLRCDMHIFSKAWPICSGGNGDSDDPPQHASPYLVPPLVALQFFFATMISAAFYIYLYAFAVLILYGLHIERQLRASNKDRSTSTIPLLRRSAHWNLNYRCLHLITKEINSCCSAILFPAQAYCVVLSAIVVAYLLIKFRLTLLVRAYAMIILLLSVLFVFVVLGNGANLVDESVLLRRVKKHRYYKSRYLRRYLWACAPFRIDFGPFIRLSQHTIYEMCAFIVNNTVALLLIE